MGGGYCGKTVFGIRPSVSLCSASAENDNFGACLNRSYCI